MDGSPDLLLEHHSLKWPQTWVTDKKTANIFQKLTTTHFHISSFPLPPLFKRTPIGFVEYAVTINWLCVGKIVVIAVDHWVCCNDRWLLDSQDQLHCCCCTKRAGILLQLPSLLSIESANSVIVVNYCEYWFGHLLMLFWTDQLRNDNSIVLCGWLLFGREEITKLVLLFRLNSHGRMPIFMK